MFKIFLDYTASQKVYNFVKKAHGLIRGKWPLPLAKLSLKLAGRSDKLTSKILRKMAFDRSPHLRVFADKYLVRSFISEKIGESFLPKLVQSGLTWDELNVEKLPRNFALKVNNASGGMIIVWDKASKHSKIPKKPPNNPWKQLVILPENFDVASVRLLAQKWLRSNYYYRIGQWPEWAYRDIQPRLIVEELLLDDHGELPTDFKFFMVNGECIYIQVDTKRFRDHRTDFYTEAWQSIAGAYRDYPNSGIYMDKPDELKEMLKIARVLSKNVDFVRVDLMLTSEGIKFGELTNYPGGGREKYTPTSLDYEFGKLWLPKY